MKDSPFYRAAASGLLSGIAVVLALNVLFPGGRSTAVASIRPAVSNAGLVVPKLRPAERPPLRTSQFVLDVEKVAWGPRTPFELVRRRLLLPVLGVSRARLTDSFFEPRPGKKLHEAIDIRAPRGTPVLAVEDGVVRLIKWHERGGLTIYVYDMSGSYSYYFAHLQKVVKGLQPGCMVSRGEVIGYVGSTGSAPQGSPHLHFEVKRIADRRAWWGGEPLDPYPAFLAGEERIPAPDPVRPQLAD